MRPAAGIVQVAAWVEQRPLYAAWATVRPVVEASRGTTGPVAPLDELGGTHGCGDGDFM